MFLKFNFFTIFINIFSILYLEPIKTNSLSEYATRRALNGLFSKVALEEKDIREDPKARVNDILKKVFDENNRNAVIGL